MPESLLLISFWSRGEEQWQFLSNFWLAPIAYKEQVWPSAEHLYQAMKFESPALREQIRRAAHPAEAKAIAKKHAGQERADWHAKKVKAMRFILGLKFAQHPELARKLLATGSAVLVHYAPWDGFWGNGKNNRGENVLGHLLMQVRQEVG